MSARRSGWRFLADVFAAFRFLAVGDLFRAVLAVFRLRSVGFGVTRSGITIRVGDGARRRGDIAAAIR
jgi:hypothetical protein